MNEPRPARPFSRRQFLAGAAVGAGAIAGTGLITEALAKDKHKTAAAEGGEAPHTHQGGEGHGAFFNDEDAATVAAFAERLMPGATGMPGARDADVLNYIDLALAGAYADLWRYLFDIDLIHRLEAWNRPADEPLTEVLADAVAGLYGDSEMDGLPAGWMREFRALVVAEPALHGEYLKAFAAAERALANAIAHRTGAETGQLEPMVLAAVTVGAERAAVLHWARQASPSAPLVDAVRTAVDMAVRGTAVRTPGAQR